VEAIVLAGGLGTRLRAAVSDLPKPMAPVSGRPFLERLLEYWIGQGVRRFVVSVGYLAERITGHFGRHWRGADITYVPETQPLGTGGGLLLAAVEARSTEFVVMNGDSFFAVPLAELTAFHRDRAADWSLALFRSPDTARYLGMEVGEGGRVKALAGAAGVREVLVNGGVYIVRASRLRELPWKPGERFSLEADLLPHGLSGGWKVFGKEFMQPFIDIGVPEDYRRAGEMLGS
jgi:D-glycero-alpha-D-manno-heptose 1-phosphate guanylyltransferase